LVDSILNDQKKMIACSVFLLKENIKMIFVSVFLVLLENGIEEILDIDLMMKKKLFAKSADAVQMNDA
jgi:malate dehydrogenase